MNKKLRRQLEMLALKEQVLNDPGLDTFEAQACDALAVLMKNGIVPVSDAPFINGFKEWADAPCYTAHGFVVLEHVRAIKAN